MKKGEDGEDVSAHSICCRLNCSDEFIIFRRSNQIFCRSNQSDKVSI